MSELRLRMPTEVKAWVEAEASRTTRSQNGLIVWVLRQQMAATAAEPNREEAGASVSTTSPPAPRIKTGRTG